MEDHDQALRDESVNGEDMAQADSPHRFHPADADSLEDTERYRFLSRDELVGSLALEPEDVVADIGSGTGFYTREVAPFVSRLYAVDMQSTMHGAFREHGVPENVTLVLGKADSLPFESKSLDRVYATMTFHEFDQDGTTELFRVLRSGGRLVLADWSASGSGERGPSLEVRADVRTASETVGRAGFEILDAWSRPETFRIVAERP